MMMMMMMYADISNCLVFTSYNGLKLTIPNQPKTWHIWAYGVTHGGHSLDPHIFAAQCYAVSVCTFVMFVSSVKTSKHIFERFSPF